MKMDNMKWHILIGHMPQNIYTTYLTLFLMPPDNNSDVIMGAITSQITSLMIVYSTVYSGADQRKHQSSASLAFVREIHRWLVSAQMGTNVENVSIWWRHHDCYDTHRDKRHSKYIGTQNFHKTMKPFNWVQQWYPWTMIWVHVMLWHDDYWLIDREH